jgi:hypothetical protein
MNHYSAARTRSLKLCNCHKLISTARVRRQALAARLETQWRELLRHATIESDPEKMLRLTTEIDQRKRAAEVARGRDRNFLRF